jgi:hypothetical protein
MPDITPEYISLLQARKLLLKRFDPAIDLPPSPRFPFPRSLTHFF